MGYNLYTSQEVEKDSSVKKPAKGVIVKSAEAVVQNYYTVIADCKPIH